MIRSMEPMKKFEIVATDCRIGAVNDFYFDDERWAIRYAVVDTGHWLPGRRVLISPLCRLTQWSEQRLRCRSRAIRSGVDQPLRLGCSAV